ncbi:MAG: sensor histidine kinase, partial [Segetibacter sp.]|nr:sensor histidine kinase [Segetibacter sp.]
LLLMLNKLLQLQVKKYFSDLEEVPAQLLSLLKEVSDTYDNCERDEKPLKNKLDVNIEVLNDLNNKLRNEADELKKAHNELGKILNSVNQGFFSRSIPDNTYTYLSLGCEKIYGYSVNDFFKNSQLWYDVIHPEDKAKIEDDEVRLNNEEEVYTQYRIIHKDNSIRWIELKIIPHVKNGKLTRVDGVVNDITSRKQVETERELMIKELLKSNADLKQFSFITSHNLRAPLSNILGILNLFDYRAMKDYDQQILEMLKVSAQQLNTTIDDLAKILIIKNNINPELTSINLETTLENLISTFANALNEVGGEVFVELRSSLIIQHKVYLESIFVNLFSNALRYRSPERTLIINVQSNEDENGNVIVRFSDNGTGIDLNRHKDRIFGLYQRFHSNIEGQGLGLFIVKSQIEATGGKIDIESEPGKGTTFILTFKKNQNIT